MTEMRKSFDDALDLVDEFDRYSVALDGYRGSPFERRVVEFLHAQGRRSEDGTLCTSPVHLFERMDDVLGQNAVEAPQVFTAQEVREALQRTSSHFAGDHVNAGVAVGRVYVELGLERAA